MRRVALTANGVRHELEVEPRELLVYVLRERLGLTGTNVGCDTSSCGACTVLVNGESVKSCTMLGVQADGMEITTIEGLATNGELHPVQQAFHDHHALQCGYCTPGMVLAAVSLIDSGERDRRGRDPRGARGEPLPLHRLPQHRRGSRRRRRGWRHDRHRDSAKRRRHLRQAQGRRLAPARAGHVRRQPDASRRPSSWRSSAARIPTPGSTSVNLDAARAAEGVVAAFTRRRPRGDWKGGLPCAWPVTEDIKMPPHFPLAVDEARYPGRRRRGRHRREPCARQGRGGAGRGRLRAAPARSPTSRRRSRTARRSSTRSSGRTSATSGSSRPTTSQAAIDAADVVVTRRYFQPRLIPNAIEPRGVLAQVGPTDEVTLWSATQVPHILRFALQLVLGIPESKIRVIAPDVGGGFGSKLDVYARGGLAVALARRLGRPVKWTEERAENYVGDDPRARRRARAHVRGDEGRDDHRRQVGGEVRDGRVPPARHAGDPAAGSVDLLRPVRRFPTTASPSPASSRTRRRRTRIAAPDGPRRPTCSSGRWTRSRASSAWIP